MSDPMLSEIAPEEFAAVLDAAAAGILFEADWRQPPIDALAVARRLGLEVAYDRRQPSRGRFVRLGSLDRRTQESIFLRPEPRQERVHWAVAHEIGEKFAHQVFAALAVDPGEAPRGARETVANHLANRLLLPGEWFFAAARDADWDLPALKERFATASHELIARRMLDGEPWVAISVFDNDRQTFRRSNRHRRRPDVLSEELECRRLVAQTGQAQTVEGAGCRVQGWPVNEADWRREILRTQFEDVWDESP